MDRLKELLGNAPSEMTMDELEAFITKRQHFIGGLLNDFRERMNKGFRKSEVKAPKEDRVSMKTLAEMLKEAGLTPADLSKLVKGEKK